MPSLIFPITRSVSTSRMATPDFASAAASFGASTSFPSNATTAQNTTNLNLNAWLFVFISFHGWCCGDLDLVLPCGFRQQERERGAPQHSRAECIKGQLSALIFLE